MFLNVVMHDVSHSVITIPIIAGTLASILHVISGPDHLAAVTPLAISSQQKGWKIGLVWGFGHLIGMLCIGVLFILFKELIPIEAISGYSEQLVAIILIAVGLWAIYQLFFRDKKHTHITESITTQEVKTLKQNVISSFSIGILHGLAGVAHFILLLPALALETRAESVQYILGFAVGTVVAMTVYSYVLGSIATFSKRANSPSVFKAIRFAGGLFAIVIGIYWLYLTF